MLKLNPAYKGLTLFLISLILSFEYNYYFNFGIFLVMILLMLINKVSIKKIILAFLPVIFLAVGVFFTGFLHSGESTDVTFLTKIVVVIGDAETGMQLAMRIMAFASIGLFFVFTTDPRLFILSLNQQFKLPRNFAYGILAAYSFIPIVKQEYQNMRFAYRARGVEKNIFMLPMFVTAVRSSESIAMAMESKGFNSKGNRSEYIKLSVSIWDYITLVVGTLIVLVGTIIF
ncbi:energy-coupling factor transporter transmembrane component T [uncultured Fusobacterium sp.]|uniref:energy-coupling factor transporter transmembrane component T family protein n=1 Tax=uncultured Fusobacterium sp. TaxID=159267 RepID=UPI0025D9A43E|nr:energy-coupling factor transporter transmembrane component T [uncultured Fusobacterium sp.]